MHTLFDWYGKRTVIATIVAIISLGGFGLYLNSDTSEEASEVVSPATTVAVATPLELQSTQSINLLGSVAAASEATILSERGGRVVSVRVSLGQSVSAGTIIATLENASEQAAVLQAEGVYEAALASAGQSIKQNDSSVRNAETALNSAQNNIVNAIQSSYSTANNTLTSVVDQFYSNPLGLSPGIRISGTDTSYLRSERIAFKSIMDEWRTEAQRVSYSAQSNTLLDTAEARIERLLLVVDHLLDATTSADRNATLNGQLVTSYSASLINERDALVATIQDIRAARNGLTQAEEALRRAAVSDTSGQTALTDAQVKQALGSLRAAQANLAKTIIRTPITGTVNALPVTVGDFISPSAQVALVANDQALEITTFVSEFDYDALQVGDEVRINNTATGIVTNLSNALDPATGKREVRIASTDPTLRAGDSVRITLETDTTAAPALDATFTLPLTAVRFAGEQGYVFIVEDGALVRVDVETNQVLNGDVTIEAGIAIDTPVVIDARGLQVGQVVTIR